MFSMEALDIIDFEMRVTGVPPVYQVINPNDLNGFDPKKI